MSLRQGGIEEIAELLRAHFLEGYSSLRRSNDNRGFRDHADGATACCDSISDDYALIDPHVPFKKVHHWTTHSKSVPLGICGN